VGLRAKIAAIFVPLLVAAVLAVSATEVNHAMRVMVDDLGESGRVLVKQTFEQIRTALSNQRGDPLATLRADRALAAFLASSSAFGKGVVYVRVETIDGQAIAGLPPAGRVKPLPFDRLSRAAARWSPLARIRPLWGEHVYEISAPVEINDHPFALIKVGLSTALIAAEVHRDVANVLVIAAVVIVVSLLGALLSGVLLAPLTAISAGFERLAAGADTGTIEIRGRDELSVLAEKFNALSQRVRLDRVQWEDERGRFMSIFRSIDDAVILLDAAGVVRFSNEEAQGRLGLPAGGLAQGKPLAALLGENHPLVNMAQTARAAATELRDVAVEQGRGRHKIPLLVSIFPLGRDPAQAGQLVIARDLNPVRELESVVDYSERLARLGELISAAAHQIRNPLNAITLELELLSHDALNGRPTEERVHAVREEISRIDEAIEALLRFMRPDRLKIERVAVNDLLTELVKGLNDPQIEVECSLDSAEPFIRADRAVLMEALRNLLQNALDAMPSGGRLTIASRLVEGAVELVISDTGQGIAPEHLNNVFCLYFTTKEDGNGVGLPLAVRAVDLHGGTLKIDSKVDAGTSVRIRLPLEEQPAARSAAAQMSVG
jgi:signal transduction histidine kinase/HAMP domain-containing protein